MRQPLASRHPFAGACERFIRSQRHRAVSRPANPAGAEAGRVMVPSPALTTQPPVRTTRLLRCHAAQTDRNCRGRGAKRLGSLKKRGFPWLHHPCLARGGAPSRPRRRRARGAPSFEIDRNRSPDQRRADEGRPQRRSGRPSAGSASVARARGGAEISGERRCEATRLLVHFASGWERAGRETFFPAGSRRHG